MALYQQWEIWQVNWVYHDGRTLPRPALLISPSEYNTNTSQLVFAKISTRDHDVGHKLSLTPEDPGFSQTGLAKKCYGYLKNVQEIEKKDVLRLRGILTEEMAELAWEIIQDAMGPRR